MKTVKKYICRYNPSARVAVECDVVTLSYIYSKFKKKLVPLLGSLKVIEWRSQPKPKLVDIIDKVDLKIVNLVGKLRWISKVLPRINLSKCENLTAVMIHTSCRQSDYRLLDESRRLFNCIKYMDKLGSLKLDFNGFHDDSDIIFQRKFMNVVDTGACKILSLHFSTTQFNAVEYTNQILINRAKNSNRSLEELQIKIDALDEAPHNLPRLNVDIMANFENLRRLKLSAESTKIMFDVKPLRKCQRLINLKLAIKNCVEVTECLSAIDVYLPQVQNLEIVCRNLVDVQQFGIL